MLHPANSCPYESPFIVSVGSRVVRWLFPLRKDRNCICSLTEHFSSLEKEEGDGSTSKVDEMPLQI